MIADIITTTPETEIVTSITVQAPIDKVFRAYTDPIHLKNWWGPNGFTNTFHEFDLQPGGKWRFTMHGPNDGHYLNECEFIIIEPPTRIAWNHFSNPAFQVLVQFSALANNTTTITFKMLFNTAAACAKIITFAVEKNEENLDRLEAELVKMI